MKTTHVQDDKIPTQLHWEVDIHVVMYLHSTWNFGIKYGTSSEGLKGLTDSDFMGNARDTRNTAGMLFTLYVGAIRWQSCLQPTIARSICEAEYMAASSGCLKPVLLF